MKGWQTTGFYRTYAAHCAIGLLRTGLLVAAMGVLLVYGELLGGTPTGSSLSWVLQLLRGPA